jgi:hypothetical protein
LDIFEIEIEDFIKINKNDLSTKDIDEIILMLENLKGKMSNVKLTVQ